MANQDDSNDESEVQNIYDESNESTGSKLRNASSKISSFIPNRFKQFGARIAKRAVLLVSSKVAVIVAVVIAVILLLVLLVGFISFLLMGPETIRAHFVKMADDIWKGVTGFFIGYAEVQVDKEKVTEVAGYLDNMGYKLEGYGFGKAERDENGKITDVDSKYLTAYLVAENKTYMIANQNFNLREFFNNITELDPNDGEWGSGMIVLNIKLWDNLSSRNVEVDREKQLLKIKMKQKASDDDSKSLVYEYNLDGWMGRYGKPIEFLLALHIGTMAPDFAYKVATSEEFDTKVRVKFHKVESKVRLKYKGMYVTKRDDTKGETWEEFLPKAQVRLNAENAINTAAGQAPKTLLDVYGIDMDDVRKARKYEDEQSIEYYKPYIRAVQKHWFRDLDFSKCYVVGKSKKTYGEYEKYIVEKQTSGDIFQISEPRIVGEEPKVTEEGVLADALAGKVDNVDEEKVSNGSVKNGTQATDTASNTTNSSVQSNGLAYSVEPSLVNGASNSVTVNGVTYTSYKQFNFEDVPFTVSGNSTKNVASSGCSATSSAIVLSGYGIDKSPREVAASMGNVLRTDSDVANVALGSNGVSATWHDGHNATEIQQALNEGKPVITLMVNSPDNFWTSGGHYVVLLGVKDDGTVLVSDPATDRDERNYSCTQTFSKFLSYVVGYAIPAQTPKNFTPGSGGNYTGGPFNYTGRYEGYRLDNLFKQKYHIADGINGVSEEESVIKMGNSIKYAISMLENTHSQDAQCILRDLKRYLTKRGIIFTDRYIMTDSKTIEERENADKEIDEEYNSLEYGGVAYTEDDTNMRGKSRRGGSRNQAKPLGSIIEGGMSGVTEEDNGNELILHYKGAGDFTGFEANKNVISPGNGDIVKIVDNGTDDIIEIELKQKNLHGKRIIIAHFQLDPSIKKGMSVSKGQKLGVTVEGQNISVTMKDEQGNSLKPGAYLPISSGGNWNGEKLNPVIGTIQGPSGKETYYNMDMSECVKIMKNEFGIDLPYWVREDGVKMYGEFVMCAANTYRPDRKKGTILETSLGRAMVVDHCQSAQTTLDQIDIAVTW